MTTIIVKPAKDNSRNRRYRQRGELMAKRREDAELAKKISKAWAKLTTPVQVYKPTTIIQVAEQQKRRNHRIWYSTPKSEYGVMATAKQKVNSGERPLHK